MVALLETAKVLFEKCVASVGGSMPYLRGHNINLSTIHNNTRHVSEI